MEDDLQALMRLEAFAHVRALAQGGQGVSSKRLGQGFMFREEKVLLLSRAEGIFKPAKMNHLLTISTRIPREGRKIWYRDQVEAHKQIYAGDDTVSYAFRGQDPNHHKNQLLRKACEYQIPIIYFVGIAPKLYEPYMVYIDAWNPSQLSARVVFSEWSRLDNTGIALEKPDLTERRYTIRQAKQRLHQTSFRVKVLEAYGGRCAISGLPEKSLLDAAHIVADSDELRGQPVISNGLLLSKIHHSAFDQNLIGVDPDCRIHVSDQLLAQQDGETLAAIKAVHGSSLLLPSRPEDQPDLDRLAQRFEMYRSAN